MKLIHPNDLLSIPRIINATFGLPVRSIVMIIYLHHRVVGTQRTRNVPLDEQSVEWRKKKKKRMAEIAQRLLANSRLAGLQTTRKQCAEDPCRISPFPTTPVSGVVAWPEWSFNYVARLHLIRHSSSSVPRESREIASPFLPSTVGLLVTPCRKKERRGTWEKEGEEGEEKERKTVGWVGELAK